MCLKYSPVGTGNVRRRLNRDGDIIAWKDIWLDLGQICSRVFEHLWRPGWNKSNRRHQSLTTEERDGKTVFEGIHVYLKKPKRRGLFIIKVRCYANDFIAAGNGEAVFTKVFVSEEEIKRIQKTL
jgi:hypothetical protein